MLVQLINTNITHGYLFGDDLRNIHIMKTIPLYPISEIIDILEYDCN